MTNARHAELGDIEELVRLREVMFSSFAGLSSTGDDAWKASAAEILLRRMSEDKPTIGITVIDAPDGSGALAACAVGTISERLPGPHNPTARYG
ncbi:hypothetical protein O1R50_20485 [Glycomyces luteolus]|uniref:GNAT family N-acetyltransferase n=1 Tax=Glycomyces luteolus TaxID=2670330 RepID=A0A9X3PN99_9ACTN|nr:hypothetical protein [Glycomyces luteolus]MDA1362015.1 hypothetical protein [Glycomyces luteolus]